MSGWFIQQPAGATFRQMVFLHDRYLLRWLLLTNTLFTSFRRIHLKTFDTFAGADDFHVFCIIPSFQRTGVRERDRLFQRARRFPFQLSRLLFHETSSTAFAKVLVWRFSSVIFGFACFALCADCKLCIAIIKRVKRLVRSDFRNVIFQVSLFNFRN